MRFIFAMLIALAAAAPALAVPLELVANGDFEQALDTGWSQSLTEPGTIDRGTTHDPDADYEVQIRKTTGIGKVQLWQSFAVPNTNIDFGARLITSAEATSTAWAVAGLLINYLDQVGFSLGTTAIVSRTSYCPWEASETLHIIRGGGAWADYGFNLDDELAFNLPGVAPGEVAAIEVKLLAEAYNC